MSEVDNILRENIRITAQVVTEICQASTLKQVCPERLSRNQFHILKILAVSGDHRSSELATILDISPAATSKNIDRLEQWGLVARHDRPEDRRSHVVRLTVAGRGIVDDFERVAAGKHAVLAAQFSDAEKQLLLEMLGRIIRGILADDHNVDLICLQCGGRCGHACVVEGRGGMCHLSKNRAMRGDSRTGEAPDPSTPTEKEE